jgi:hypothetical protein
VAQLPWRLVMLVMGAEAAGARRSAAAQAQLKKNKDVFLFFRRVDRGFFLSFYSRKMGF